MKKHSCIVIGAGPSGVGVGVALKELGVDFVILEKGKVGNSFLEWTKETKFISPSFTSNMFMIPDLNAVTPLTSPAFSFNKEHLSGIEYYEYLNIITNHYGLKVEEGVGVVSIQKLNEEFVLNTSNGEKYTCEYLIWCGGEWSFPKEVITNSIHSKSIKSYLDLTASSYVVIGGGESGVDAAYNLVKLGKSTTLISENDILKNSKQNDPSKKLSPVTIQKFNEIVKSSKLKYVNNTKVSNIEKKGEGYVVNSFKGSKVNTKTVPILANGFKRVPDIIADLVDIKGGDLSINKYDESKKVKNLFFAGPNLHRDNVILCFIYKFRMRFAVVACEIAKRQQVRKEHIKKVSKFYKKYNMYLEDIHACDINCDC